MSPNSIGYIYLIIDHFNNKMYAGQSVKLQPWFVENYYGSGTIIKKIIKHRKHHLEKRILGYCFSIEELNKCEEEVIEFYDLRNAKYGYNLVVGGGSSIGWHPSPKTRRKMSKSA